MKGTGGVFDVGVVDMGVATNFSVILAEEITILIIFFSTEKLEDCDGGEGGEGGDWGGKEGGEEAGGEEGATLSGRAESSAFDMMSFLRGNFF